MFFPKKTYRWATIYEKMFKITITEMQIKATLRHHLILVKISSVWSLSRV